MYFKPKDRRKLDERLTEEELRNLTIGVYQIILALCHVREYLDEDGISEVFVCNINDNILCVKIQSRHISSKFYRVLIQYNAANVVSWYIQCKVGTRVVGTRSHVTVLIWYLRIGRFTDKIFN